MHRESQWLRALAMRENKLFKRQNAEYAANLSMGTACFIFHLFILVVLSQGRLFGFSCRLLPSLPFLCRTLLPGWCLSWGGGGGGVGGAAVRDCCFCFCWSGDMIQSPDNQMLRRGTTTTILGTSAAHQTPSRVKLVQRLPLIAHHKSWKRWELRTGLRAFQWRGRRARFTSLHRQTKPCKVKESQCREKWTKGLKFRVCFDRCF